MALETNVGPAPFPKRLWWRKKTAVSGIPAKMKFGLLPTANPYESDAAHQARMAGLSADTAIATKSMLALAKRSSDRIGTSNVEWTRSMGCSRFPDPTANTTKPRKQDGASLNHVRLQKRRKTACRRNAPAPKINAAISAGMWVPLTAYQGHIKHNRGT